VSLAKPIADYETVRTWRRGLEEQWGSLPEGWEGQLEALAAFCGFVAKEPDEIIAECTRLDAEGEKRIRIKGRRFYSEKIEEWQGSLEGDRFARGRAGNAIRSFLIHNGIFIQAGLQGG
jgi:hypothetical protein